MNIKHRHAKRGVRSPTYVVWTGMKQRCLNPNASEFARYGGRGIRLCRRWLKFENFLEDMGERPPGTSIDRIDGRKGYSKRNCRWATDAEQQANRTFKKCPHGLIQRHCAPCLKEYQASYYRANRERLLVEHRNWYAQKST